MSHKNNHKNKYHKNCFNFREMMIEIIIVENNTKTKTLHF